MGTLAAIIVGGVLGFILANIRFFREEKHRAYRELLPPILKCGYHPDKSDQDEFNIALTKLWLYGSTDVATKMDTAVSIIIRPGRGDLTAAFQEGIVAMRKDLRMNWPWGRLKSTDVAHIYTIIREQKPEV
jgi:hypothetical protein